MISHFDHARTQKVTIEDLLRLKRAERPDPKFWDRFEQDLRAKQLAAIVERRPWWRSLRLPHLPRFVSKLYVPAGASALVIFGLVVVRENMGLWQTVLVSEVDVATVPPVRDSSAVVRVATIGDRAEGASVSADALPSYAPVLPYVPASYARPANGSKAAPVSSEGAIASAYAVTSQRPSVSGIGGLMEMIPWAAPVAASDDRRPRTPLVVGELPQASFATALLSGRDYRFDSRVEVDSAVMPRRTSVAAAKPKEQAPPVLSPREVRRDRILSNLVVADNMEIERSRMGQVREVLVSALDDDRLYDSVRRLGMGGDRLTLKF